MKLSRNLFSITLASLLLAATAFASPSKGTLKLFEPVTVQGKQLAPGEVHRGVERRRPRTFS